MSNGVLDTAALPGRYYADIQVLGAGRWGMSMLPVCRQQTLDQ